MSTEQAQRFLEKISTAQVKNKLKETTDAACNYGVSNSKYIPILPEGREGMSTWVLMLPS